MRVTVHVSIMIFTALLQLTTVGAYIEAPS